MAATEEDKAAFIRGLAEEITKNQKVIIEEVNFILNLDKNPDQTNTLKKDEKDIAIKRIKEKSRSCMKPLRDQFILAKRLKTD